ncbi:SMP-30/gluconolactonase/LRE family protein [Actinomadura kijaniata]|uniref:SMP-30/gluconolactonase/LRE family protein n=1 Tax=Actinomadura kijaniata TaxID=46161 RepID=UPI003F1D2404
MTDWDIAVPGRALLGEGPVWDPSTGTLLWVDILSSEVHSYGPATGDALLHRTGQHVGAALPRAGGGLVVNLRDGVGLYDADGAFGWLAEFPEEGCRGNDAAVAPDGALWAGTMRYDEAPGGGRLRRIHPDGTVETVLADVTVSNGLGWSPDGRLMYYVDSPTRRVDVFDEGGRRPFAHLPGPGIPDGLTVDADGCVWVAVWEGGRVLRYTPTGALDRVLDLPVARTTACAFGGPDLRDLYVTTAALDAPAGEPHAGALFVFPGIGAGLPSPPFPG